MGGFINYDTVEGSVVLSPGQQIEFIANGNTAINQDGNTRIRMNSSNELVTETRVSGVWTQREIIAA